MIFTDAGLGDFLSGSVNWSSSAWRLYCVDSTAFTPSSDPHLSELTSGSIIAYGTIPDLVVSGRTATCGIIGITSPPSGKTIAGMWVVQWTGTTTTSRLTAFTDLNSDSTPISYLTDGSNIAIEFSPYVLSI